MAGPVPRGYVTDDGCGARLPSGGQANCLLIAWPGWKTTASHAWGDEGPDIDVWYGGLVDGMRDASGQMYMRNRYYDPATGQFTQTDPIGLAGGLNAYGFAAGDPVSYSDPYGTCSILTAAGSVAVGWGVTRALGAEYRVRDALLDAGLGCVGAVGVRYLGRTRQARRTAQVVAVTAARADDIADAGLVIGKLDDLRHLRPGERVLRWAGRGNSADDWAENAGRLRAEMRRGQPIRDASVNPRTGELNKADGFLRAERNLLEDRGWTYDRGTQHWLPPTP